MSNESNLYRIKKIITVSTGYTSEGVHSCEQRVNQLLEAGWIVLEIQKNDCGDPKTTFTIVTYHLGNIDPKAKTFDGSELLKED